MLNFEELQVGKWYKDLKHNEVFKVLEKDNKDKNILAEYLKPYEGWHMCEKCSDFNSKSKKCKQYNFNSKILRPEKSSCWYWHWYPENSRVLTKIEELLYGIGV